MKRYGGVVKGSVGVVCVGFVFLFCVGIANATITYEASGIIITDPDGKAYETPVSLRADLSISGDTLTLVLTNQSEIVSPYLGSPFPDTLLTSFFFDILNSSDERPTLSYDDARGDVYNGILDATDTLIELNADLQAFVDNDDTWMFRGDLNPLFDPGLAFGIGTVGNNGLTDQNGDGNATQ
ncbi:MAG: XDD4 family exosortase-dependent surface protein, partial [Planctomycetota bacterium]